VQSSVLRRANLYSGLGPPGHKNVAKVFQCRVLYLGEKASQRLARELEIRLKTFKSQVLDSWQM